MTKFLYMLTDFLCNSFEHLVGKRQDPLKSPENLLAERRALLIILRVEKQQVKILLFAPMNYVGVYLKTGDEHWTCIGYHNSCWRDVLQTYLHKQKDNEIGFEFFPQVANLDVVSSVGRSVLIIKLTKEEIEALHEIRDKKR